MLVIFLERRDLRRRVRRQEMHIDAEGLGHRTPGAEPKGQPDGVAGLRGGGFHREGDQFHPPFKTLPDADARATVAEGLPASFRSLSIRPTAR